MKQYEAGKKSTQGFVVKQAQCPVCNTNDLDYGTVELNGNLIYYPWQCNSCKSIGEEWYFTEYIGHNVTLEKQEE